MKKYPFIVVCISMLFLVSALSANSRIDPLDFMSGRADTKKGVSKNNKISHKKRSTARYISSKRSLASFGRMGGEYIGKVKNSTATKLKTDLNIYTRHVLTGKSYLDNKAIDGPMPQDYDVLFFKSKTLLNPVKPYFKIVVDKSQQRIFVYRDLEHIYTFKSSTGRRGYGTRTGTFKPYRITPMHYSRKYYNSPMPWSVFYYGGYAIHGTSSISKLGRPASHGCVRTHPNSARRIYKLIKKYGKKNTTIIVRN